MLNDSLRTPDFVALLVKAMEALTCGVLITDRKANIVWSNAGVTRLTGYSAEDLCGRSTSIFQSGKQDAPFYRELWRTIISGNPWRGAVANRCKDGTIVYVDELIVPIFDETGELTHFVALQLDLAPSGVVGVEQRWMAYHDALTRLPNRPRFMECLGQAIDDHTKNGQAFCVMFLDLDRFKPVNDRYGHHIGDLLLQAIANRICATLRATDVVARFGGDEFVVIARNLEAVGQGRIVAQKIVDSLIRPFRIERNVVEVGVSIGVAAYPSDGCDGAALLERSDMAMYHAKTAGGSRVCLYRDLPPGYAGQVKKRLA